MPDGNESKIQELDGDPKDPLGLLGFPQDIRNAIVDLIDCHSLHGTHGTVINGVGYPAPVDELFHDCLEDRDAQSGDVGFDGQPFQKVVVHVGCRSVKGKAKEHGPTGSWKVVYNVFGGGCCCFVVVVIVAEGNLGNQLGDDVSNAPQNTSGNRFGLDRRCGQVTFVPFHE